MSNVDQATLAEIFLEQAQWRDRKTEEYPDDDRNVGAASHLRMLAEDAKNADQALITATEELFDDAPDTERWSEMLRQEGFHTFHDSAASFLQDFISVSTSGR